VRFGISTHLYHHQALAPAHLAEVAAHGFLLVELFATRTHFDYHEEAAARDLGSWLTDAGLFLHSVHAPIVEGASGGAWGASLSIAVSDAAQRARAVRETQAAVALAQVIPYEYLVVHVGVPDERVTGPGQNSVDAARRSIEEIHATAAKHGVRLALEVIPNKLSSAESLIRLIDEDLELPDVGICLDYGHAFLMGDLADTIEIAAGHMLTTHIHDNRGDDAHMVPFDGKIDWSTAVMTTQKVGYEGVWLMEVANTGDTADVLGKARAACQQLEQLAVSL
jgi:sugar phosphate isomerase/epimerase